MRTVGTWATAAAVGVLAAACGTQATAPAVRSLPQPPSTAVLRHLLPTGNALVKVATLRFNGRAPEDVVVAATTPPTSQSVSSTLDVVAVSWDAATQRWHVSWRSPVLALQRQVAPGQAQIPAVSSWQVHATAHGALVGLLDPASLGADTIWDNGLIIWVPAGGAPKALWVAKGSRLLVPDGILKPTRHGILLRQDVCSAVEVQVPAGATLPQVANLTCTDLLAATAGQHLLVTATAQGATPAVARLTVHAGATVVFWPSNPATATQVNQGTLDLYGGDISTEATSGQVPLALVDSIPDWSYTFTSPGTYVFAMVPDTSLAASAPVSLTVQVTG